MTQKYVTKRWRCNSCGNSGWSKDGVIPAHDNDRGTSCRTSGQKSERTIKTTLDYEYCSAETAYGRTVPVPFTIKVF